MRSCMRVAATIACTVALLILPAQAAFAQTYPNKPVRMVVSFAAGGPVDLVAREVGRELEKALGQPFIIDNQGGGLGVSAMNTVSRAAPDGHTLLFAASGNITIQPLFDKNRSDVLKQLAPVGLISISPHVLVVSGKLPVKSVKDLLDYARAHPGKVNFGSAGVGGVAHLGMELFRSMAGIDVAHVPYKGTSQVITDMVSGEVHAMFSSMPSLKPMIDKGYIRAIGMTAPTQAANAKGIPTIDSAGLPGFEYSTWYALYSAVGTPAPIVEKLNAALHTILADPALEKKLEVQGIDLQSSSTAELIALMRRDTQKWEKVIREANVKLD